MSDLENNSSQLNLLASERKRLTDAIAGANATDAKEFKEQLRGVDLEIAATEKRRADILKSMPDVERIKIDPEYKIKLQEENYSAVSKKQILIAGIVLVTLALSAWAFYKLNK